MKLSASRIAPPYAWYEVDPPPGRKVPHWQRRVARAADGTVFVPAAIAGREQAIALCAGFDGVPAIVEAGHVYLPVCWLALEYPDVAELCARIGSMIAEAAAAPTA
jgi:hypothetical protein